MPVWVIGINQLGVIARGEPSWARKYKADCTLCHTVYPRLNRTGYEFKRLGYRLPREVQAVSHQPYVVKKEYQPQPETAESGAGRAVVEKLTCASCHSIGGKGGQIGPPLDGVGGRRSPEFLKDHITNPEEHAKQFPELHENKPNRMPHPNATAEEINQMVAFLLTLPEPAGGFLVRPHEHGPLPDSAPPANFVPAPASEASRAGEKLYLDMGCAACHSIGSSGGEFGPKLDGIGARRNRPFIAAHITNPQLHSQRFPNEHTGEATMPPTNAAPDQIQQITEYLMTLAATSQAGSEIPKNRIQDYLAVSYIPSMEIEQGGGETKTTFEKRDLIIYAAGPVGRYFSFFVQPTPASEEKGFGGKFEMAQGLFNYGGTRNFLQVRFGQMFNLRNAGFGGTDRGLTETLPFIFQPANGFSPAGLGRGASVEYTLHGTSTFKVFSNVNEVPELEAESEGDESVPELKRSRTYGAVWEQVIGSKGLSGFSVEFAGGRTPVLFGDSQQSQLRFQRYTVVANKSILDKKNAERVNAIFGYSLLRDNRVLGVETDGRSHGQGYFAEIDAVPIVGHLGCYGRFDQIRETSLLSGNTIRGGTVGVIYDPVRYARVLFEYQHIGKLEIPNRYTIGLQFNF
ncbi:MAG: cytochrome c [Chloroflexi bacterium]|nr:cytochrome c [Chloroflexota bacterium]